MIGVWREEVWVLGCERDDEGEGWKLGMEGGDVRVKVLGRPGPVLGGVMSVMIERMQGTWLE